MPKQHTTRYIASQSRLILDLFSGFHVINLKQVVSISVRPMSGLEVAYVGGTIQIGISEEEYADVKRLLEKVVNSPKDRTQVGSK